MINQREAYIKVDEIKIPFLVTLNEFLETGIKPHINNFLEGDFPRVTTVHLLNQRRLVMTFIFNPDNFLYILSLGFWDINESSSWNDWSEKRERKRKCYHDWFLFIELGFPPYRYEWGSISSNFELKTGMSYISILIKQDKEQ